MENRVIALNKQLNDSKAESQQTQDNLNGQISGLQADLEASSQENESLRQEIAALQADAEALRGDLSQSRNNTQIMENRVIALNQTLDSTKAAAQEEQTRLNGRIDALEATLQETQASLSAERQENEALNTQLTNTSATLAQTQDALTAKRQENDALNTQLTNTSAALAQTQETLNSTNTTLAQTQASLTAEIQSNEEKRQRISALEDDLLATQAIATEESDRNAMLLGQLENLVAAMQTETTFQLVDTDTGDGDKLSALLNQYVGLETQADASIRRQGILPQADQEEDGSEIVLTVNGETVSRAKVERALETSLLIRKHVLEQHPEWEGQPSLSLDRTVAARQIITQMAENMALWQKAQSLGLDVMTDAELQALIDAAIEQQAITGYSAEEMLPSLLVSQTLEKLRDWAAQDVTVTEEEFLKELPARRSASQAQYESDPDAFCQVVESGKGYYHYPTALRRIKQIFLPTDVKAYEQLKSDLEETRKYIDELDYAIYRSGNREEIKRLKQKREAMKEKLEKLQAQWDATAGQSEQALQQAQQAAADIYARLSAGESFDTLIAEYSQDTEMPENGYVIGDGRKLPFRDFVVRALNLPRVGSVTKVIVADDGYHILYYAEDLTKDWDSLRNNKVALFAEMLAEKRQQAADEAIAQWISEADIQIAPNLFSF